MTIVVPSTVTAHAAFTVSVSGGPANVLDWVGLYIVGATPDQGNYLQWQFLNGTQTPPTTGLTTATVSFMAPSDGTYEIRWFTGGGYTPLATSTPITVGHGGSSDGPLVIHGDSNTATTYVSPPDNWATRVAAYLGLPLVNMAVSGRRAAGVLSDIPAMLAHHPAICMVMVGTNDMAHDIEVGEAASTSLAQYLQRMRSIVLQLRSGCSCVVIVSPVMTLKAREVARLDDWSRGLRSLSADGGATFVDLFSHMKARSDTLTETQFRSLFILPDVDAYHLSAAGHALIADAVSSYGRWP